MLGLAAPMVLSAVGRETEEPPSGRTRVVAVPRSGSAQRVELSAGTARGRIGVGAAGAGASVRRAEYWKMAPRCAGSLKCGCRGTRRSCRGARRGSPRHAVRGRRAQKGCRDAWNNLREAASRRATRRLKPCRPRPNGARALAGSSRAIAVAAIAALFLFSRRNATTVADRKSRRPSCRRRRHLKSWNRRRRNRRNRAAAAEQQAAPQAAQPTPEQQAAPQAAQPTPSSKPRRRPHSQHPSSKLRPSRRRHLKLKLASRPLRPPRRRRSKPQASRPSR